MRTCDFIDVLRGALALCGIEEGALQTAEFNCFRTWADAHLTRASESYFFPDHLRLEQRFFRADYASGTAYSNDGTVVYYPPTQRYYYALKSTTGNAPADSNGATDTARWFVASTAYSGDTYSATRAYVAGNTVYYPTTNLYYVCHTASTGNVPSNTSYWGRQYEFDRYIAYEQTGCTAIGQALSCHDRNPRTWRNAVELDFELSQNGVQIPDDVPYVWLNYRIRPPRLTGAAYSATTAYTAGQQIYYSSTTTAGNFYDCATSTSAGESPDSAAAKWSVVSIPFPFKFYLQQVLYAEWLAREGQGDKSLLEQKKAFAWLDQQMILLGNQQQQRQRTRVATR